MAQILLDATRHRYVDANGYVRLRLAPGVEVYEHRHVWEQAHGPIPDGHHIHHVNRNRADNRLENLRCVERREHFAEHVREWWDEGVFGRPASWVDLDDDYIVQRRNEGASFRAIAREIGSTHPAVARHYRIAIGEHETKARHP